MSEISLISDAGLGKRLVYCPGSKTFALQTLVVSDQQTSWSTAATSKILSKKVAAGFSPRQISSAKARLHAVRYAARRFKA